MRRPAALFLACLFAAPAVGAEPLPSDSPRYLSPALSREFLGASSLLLRISPSFDRGEMTLCIPNPQGSAARFRMVTCPLSMAIDGSSYRIAGLPGNPRLQLTMDPSGSTASLTLRDDNETRAVKLYRPKRPPNPTTLETEP
ncbi:MAG: hypothetical protein KGR26_07305 [Cyanobacteria bacterium REEB65]|nr:hypothetical protein [Cyanobacteria bacterium REEB65]